MRSAPPEPMSWRKSSLTSENDCVEMAWPAAGGAVRDSKNAAGPVLRFGEQGLAHLIVGEEGLAHLIAGAKAGAFDQ